MLWAASAVAAAVIAFHAANALRLEPGPGIIRQSSTSLLDRVRLTTDRARSEYQELALARLPPNPNTGEFFRFDDNYLSADVSAAPAAENGSENLVAWEFDGSDEVALVTASGRSHVEQRDGLLVVRQSGSDRLVNEAPLNVPMRDLSEVIVRARVDRGNRFLLSWATADNENLLSRNSMSLDLIGDGEFHTYVVDAQNGFARPGDHDGNLSTLAITPSNVNGATVEIDFIRVTSRLGKYRLAPTGTTYHTIGDEMRSVLYMVPDQTLEYSVEIPTERPSMRFGVATLSDGIPLELTVSITVDGTTSTLFTSSSVRATQWLDVSHDLSAWSGRDATLSFEARGPADNVLFVSSPALSSSPERRFNVILILEDALRADHVSTYGYGRDTSPAKTAFINDRGVVFLNAHSQATETRPSVPSLMTSLYPTATGVLNFSHMLSERYLTLAEVLRAQGFETASFIQNGNAGPMAGLHQGFDTLVSFDNTAFATENVFGERVLDWVDATEGRNFFLYLHAQDPHGVYDPPSPFDRSFGDDEPRAAEGRAALERSYLDPAWLDEPTAEGRKRLYDGEILHNDTVLHAFLDDLDRRGLLENTLLIFTADHGEWLGEEGNWDHHPPGRMPVVHVPLMMAYPDLGGKGKRIEDSVQLIDVMPTILELAGVDTRDLLMHGDSLVSLVHGEDPERWANRITLSEEPVLMTRGEPCICGSVFVGDWQMHGSTADGSTGIRGSVLPFLETSALRFKEDGMAGVGTVSADLRYRLLRHHVLSGVSAANTELWRRITAGENQEEYRMDPETLERLRGLGYVN